MSTAIPEVRPAIVTLDEATVINAFGGVITSLRAEDTAGRISLVDFSIEPSPHGPQMHVHDAFDETYYVLEGTLTVLIDGDEFTATAGDSIFIPRGVVHTFANHGEVDARFLLIMSPGGFERCFDDLAAEMAAHGEVTPEAFAQITSDYDVRIVERDS